MKKQHEEETKVEELREHDEGQDANADVKEKRFGEMDE